MKLPQTISIFTAVGAVFFGTMQADTKAEQQLENIDHRPDRPTIKVFLTKDMEGAQVEVKSGYALYDPNTGKKMGSSVTASSFYMYPTTEGIKWGEEFPGIYQMLIVPKRPGILLSGIEYAGMLYAYQIEGALAFVNELSVDDYVRSILSTQLPASLHNKEIIAACAIVARTDAVNRARNGKATFWDVKGSLFQYQGSGVLRHDAPFDEALRSTRQMVLTKGSLHEDVRGFEVNWFDPAGNGPPLEQLQKYADEEETANEMLIHCFPDARIALVD